MCTDSGGRRVRTAALVAGAFAALQAGNERSLEEFLHQAERDYLAAPCAWSFGSIALCRGWTNFEHQMLGAALHNFVSTLSAAQSTGFELGFVQSYIGSAFVLTDMGRSSEAAEAIESARRKLPTCHAPACHVALSFASAYLAICRDGPSQARSFAREAMARFAEYRLLLFPLAPRAVRTLISAVLDDGEAHEVARELQARYHLDPPRDDVGPAWSWPVRIRTLGAFGVYKGASPDPLSASAPADNLIKVLIAAEGEPLAIDRLVAALWRGSNNARAAFDTTVHRVRRSLGPAHEDLLLVERGSIRLAADRVWVDAWALAHLQERAVLSVNDVQRWEDLLFSLYRGPFCSDDGLPGLARARTRYLRTFERAVGSVAEAWRELDLPLRARDVMILSAERNELLSGLRSGLRGRS